MVRAVYVEDHAHYHARMIGMPAAVKSHAKFIIIHIHKLCYVQYNLKAVCPLSIYVWVD